MIDMSFVTTHEIASRLLAHRHQRPYVSLVLRGRYHEQSIDGRYAVEAGSIVYHPPYHLHANTFDASSNDWATAATTGQSATSAASSA